MPTGHSWKWLAPRLSAQQVRDFARGDSSSADDRRPCLPTVEALGDRLMFSVSAGATAGATTDPGTPPPSDPAGILIGLLKGELSGDDAFIKGELSFLKTAVDYVQKKHIGGVKYEDFHRLSGDLIKVNDIIWKFAEDVLSGRLPAVQKLRADLDAALLKLKTDGDVVDGGTEKSPVDDSYIKIELGSRALLDAEAGFGKIKSPNKLYANIADGFEGVTAGLIKLQEDVLLQKSRVGDEIYLKIKLADVLVSSFFVSDSQIKGELIGLLRTSLDIHDDVLHGGGGGSGGQAGTDPSDGVTAPSLNGDLLS